MRALGVVAATAVILVLGGGRVSLAAGDAAKGDTAFQKYCTGCHGAKGKGDGPMSAALNPKVKDLSNKTYNGSLKDDYLIKIIKNGGEAVGKSPMMPKASALKDGEVADVIAYIRSLAK